MEYFIYCRDRADSGELRDRLIEEHWSFMDGYADGMIARGPTLTEDGDTATGSMHIVRLPDAEAARVFAFEEPNYRAGVYREVLVHRWSNELGGTMWDYDGDPVTNRRFLVLQHANSEATREPLREQHSRYLQSHRRELIAAGPLLSEDGTGWLGTVLLTEQPTRAAVDTLLADDPFSGRYADREVHFWEFGGRR